MSAERYRLEIIMEGPNAQSSSAEGDIRVCLGALGEWVKGNLYPYGLTRITLEKK